MCVRLLAALAPTLATPLVLLALGLSAATPAVAQGYGYCYYTAALLWVCPPVAGPRAYYRRAYARERCWRRHGRWVCAYR